VDYYKFLNKNENHNGMHYQYGLNTDIRPFYPHGDCTKGGIYFSREDILAFINKGQWIRKVTLPEGEEIYENPGFPKKWKAHRVILGRKYKVTAKVVQRLIEEGADVHADNDYALRWASAYGEIEIVRVLLENGANVHAQEECALCWASNHGETEIVKLLLENGADATVNNNEPSYLALERGHTNVVKLLKKAQWKARCPKLFQGLVSLFTKDFCFWKNPKNRQNH